MKKFKSKVLFTMFCGSFSYIAFANPILAPTSSVKPQQASAADIMKLQVRSAKISGIKNSTKYSGNVEISEGNFVITADTAIAKQNKFAISGKPAKFVDIVSANQKVAGSAKTMVFDAKENQLVLNGDAYIAKNGKVEEKQDRIIYNTTTHEYKLK